MLKLGKKVPFVPNLIVLFQHGTRAYLSKKLEQKYQKNLRHIE